MGVIKYIMKREGRNKERREKIKRNKEKDRDGK